MTSIAVFCGVTGNRTRDTRIFSPLLYQLSYDTIVVLRTPILFVWDCKGRHFFINCKFFLTFFQSSSKFSGIWPIFLGGSRSIGQFSYLRSLMNEVRYISVILPLKLEWEPCYSTTSDLHVGGRVRVMFAGKEYVGAVSAVGIVPDVDPGRIKPIVSVEDSLEDIFPEEIELWRRVAQYYMCTIGEVYKAAYPSGKLNLEEARAAAREKLLKRKKRILNSIGQKQEKLKERLERKENEAAAAKEGTKKRETLIRSINMLKEEISRVHDALTRAEQAYSDAEKGTVRYTWPQGCSSITLSPAQKKAEEEIQQGFRSQHPVLLHGVTGSGKTEIYIRLAAETIGNGKNVLYLVPEIALSRQLEERLYEHFGDSLMTFHSGETAAGRMNTAETIRQTRRNGGTYIILGTRSSLYLPHHNLGLIIVDEEHDSSYKQDSPAPRYNGRDTALMLYQLHKANGNDCNIILGTATPSLEELYNCMTGRHVKVDLKERFHGSEDSAIEIIDTRAERRKRGMTGNFSRKLMDHIRRTLENKGQVLILRSRRSWAPAMQCMSCGTIEKCPHCNVSLSFHKDAGRMVCHYCGYSRPVETRCTRCGGEMAGLGAGTQKIEEELTSLFPQARISRLDSDNTQNKKHEAETIRSFSKGEIDILVGTQIIAKGFDFSNLSLVAVIAADSLLGIQDFRADEKALHLLEQFRGRCGRRGTKGLFVIQTSQPDHPIYRRLSENDADTFSMQLLQERKDFLFPPYSRIVEITVKDIYEDRCTRMASMLAETLKAHFEAVTGPYSPAVDRIADHHIRMIRLSLKKDRNLVQNKALLKKLMAEFEKARKYDGHITVNVDPS